MSRCLWHRNLTHLDEGGCRKKGKHVFGEEVVGFTNYKKNALLLRICLAWHTKDVSLCNTWEAYVKQILHKNPLLKHLYLQTCSLSGCI